MYLSNDLHYSEVPWELWRLKSPATLMFVQKWLTTNNRDMQKAFPCHEISVSLCLDGGTILGIFCPCNFKLYFRKYKISQHLMAVTYSHVYGCVSRASVLECLQPCNIQPPQLASLDTKIQVTGNWLKTQFPRSGQSIIFWSLVPLYQWIALSFAQITALCGCETHWSSMDSPHNGYWYIWCWRQEIWKYVTVPWRQEKCQLFRECR